MDQAKHPVTTLAGRYGHPLHPALVAVPIGAWVASFAFDLATRFVPGSPDLADGARWLIGLGVVGALAAALVGFLDLFAIPTGTRAFRTALAHMAINLAVTGGYAVNFALRDGGPPGAGPLALSAVGLAGLAVGGYLGGELAYRYGVRVADERTQAQGYHHAEKEND
ncbi:DUF2231 domain-containing protein [Micromonospora sp. NPDC050495]|uniref:DUF2231 domain-containing protein n=1 Tax=Micromonospora sp. NPDC050495 TaxID=3154936 RepID=UPI0033D1C81F